jgi:2-keto-4-pentenoate hydratase
MATLVPPPVRAQSQWGAPDPNDPRLIEGYARQERQLTQRLRAGAKFVGVKVGANDPATQERLGLSGPLTGYLTSDGIVDAGTPIAIGECTLVGVEPELAITVSHDILAGASLEDIGHAIACVGLCGEIIEVRGRYDDVAGLVGGNVMHRGVALGAAPIAYDTDTLFSSWLHAHRNGAEVWSLPLGKILGDPREALRFVANALAHRGEALVEGLFVMTGLLTPLPLWVMPGDSVALDAGPFGTLDLRFVAVEDDGH